MALTLALVDPTKLGETRVVKDFSDIPRVQCRPKELNQVFMTLIVNALESMKGKGELTLVTSASDATLRSRWRTRDRAFPRVCCRTCSTSNSVREEAG